MRVPARGRQALLLQAASALPSLHIILLQHCKSATNQPCCCLKQLKVLLQLPLLAVSAVVQTSFGAVHAGCMAGTTPSLVAGSCLTLLLMGRHDVPCHRQRPGLSRTAGRATSLQSPLFPRPPCITVWGAGCWASEGH